MTLPPTWDRSSGPPRLSQGGTWLPRPLLPRQLQEEAGGEQPRRRQPLQQQGQGRPAIQHFGGASAAVWCQAAAGHGERVLVGLGSGCSLRGVGGTTLVSGYSSNGKFSAGRKRQAAAVLQADGEAVAAGKGRATRLLGSGGLYVLDQAGFSVPGEYGWLNNCSGLFGDARECETPGHAGSRQR